MLENRAGAVASLRIEDLLRRANRPPSASFHSDDDTQEAEGALDDSDDGAAAVAATAKPVAKKKSKAKKQKKEKPKPEEDDRSVWYLCFCSFRVTESLFLYCRCLTVLRYNNRCDV